MTSESKLVRHAFLVLLIGVIQLTDREYDILIDDLMLVYREYTDRGSEYAIGPGHVMTEWLNRLGGVKNITPYLSCLKVGVR